MISAEIKSPAFDGRLAQLDVLRTVAVGLVLFRHADPAPVEFGESLGTILEFVIRGAWVGVDIFFVLSGFLVSTLLFREYEKTGKVNITRFLIRRGFKIYPAFWVLIFVTLGVTIYRHGDFSLRMLGAELAFVQNYFQGMWGHTWSLAVEEHFYLLLAGGFWILIQRKSTEPLAVFPLVIALIAVSCLAMRLASVGETYDFQRNSAHSHLRIDSLAIGVLIAYARYRAPGPFGEIARRFRHWSFLIGLALLVPLFLLEIDRSPFVYTYGYVLGYMAGGFLLLGALGSVAPKGYWLAGAAFVGTHSYSIYLWHSAVENWFAVPLSAGNWLVYMLIYFLGSVLVGIGMAKMIEGPSLRVRDRLFPAQTAVPSVNKKVIKPEFAGKF